MVLQLPCLLNFYVSPWQNSDMKRATQPNDIMIQNSVNSFDESIRTGSVRKDQINEIKQIRVYLQLSSNWMTIARNWVFYQYQIRMRMICYVGGILVFTHFEIRVIIISVSALVEKVRYPIIVIGCYCTLNFLWFNREFLGFYTYNISNAIFNHVLFTRKSQMIKKGTGVEVGKRGTRCEKLLVDSFVWQQLIKKNASPWDSWQWIHWVFE